MSAALLPGTAGPRVAATDVILREIAFHVPWRKRYNLCLVSKAFKDACTPALYETFVIQSILHSYFDMDIARYNPSIGLIRQVVCRVPHSQDHLEQILQELTPRMTFLRALVLLGGAQPERDTLFAIQTSCPSLSALALNAIPWLDEVKGRHEGEWDPNFEGGYRPPLGTLRPYLPAFRGLTSLALFNLGPRLERWKADIAACLGESPGLEGLSLSISKQGMDEIVMATDRDPIYNFFRSLCDAYGASGAAPLALRRLYMGLGVILLPDTDPNEHRGSVFHQDDNFPGRYQYTASYLHKLTRLDVLEEVYVQNEDYFGDDFVIYMFAEDGFSGMAWWTFSAVTTPNLRRLTAYELSPEVVEYLGEAFTRGAAENLALSFQELEFGQRGDDEIVPFYELYKPNSKLPNLPLAFRMLVADLAWASEKLANASKRASETNSESSFYFESEADREAAVAETAAQWETLEGLKINMPEPDVGTQAEDLLADIVSRLDRLTQLEVNRGQMAGETTTEGQTPAAALRLAGLAPRLRHIKYGGLAWRVWRQLPGDDGGTRAVDRLEALDEHDTSRVELYHGPGATNGFLTNYP